MTGLLLALLLSLVARELWGWIPPLTRCVLWLITVPLPAERRARRREEWARHLADEFEERRLAGLLWALQLCRVCVLEIARRLRGRLRFYSMSLRRIPASEQAVWRALATFVVMLAAIAGVSMAMAVSLAFGLSPLLATFPGIGWGVCILLIERLVHAIRPDDRGSSGGAPRLRKAARTLLAVFPRLALSVLLGYATALPLLLRMFEPEIAAQAGRTHNLSLSGRIHALTAVADTHPSVFVVETTVQVLFLLLFVMPLAVRLYLCPVRRPSFSLYL
jgi:Domain of unknown function (DUF4407)